MVRKIIKINQELCSGCGICVTACHENAIRLINGKACLMREDYCDGLGDCLPACPTDAISFEEREAKAYNETAVKRSQASNQLRQWPVQIKLMPLTAPYYQDADLLIAADCTAYAYGNFHRDFIHGRVVLVGCPKLDQTDYSQKLSAIFSQNSIRSITLTRMEVPCCGGLEYAVRQAIAASGKSIPLKIITISTEGILLSEDHTQEVAE